MTYVFGNCPCLHTIPPLAHAPSFLVPVASMPVEFPGGGELAELVADHVFGDIHRHMRLAVMNRDGQADHHRQNCRSARPRLDNALVAAPGHPRNLLEQGGMDIGAFLGRTRHRILFPFRLPAPAGVTTSQNILIGPLVMAGPEAHRWLAPGCLWLAADWRASLTTTMRVVHWIHHRAAHMRAAPQIARASGLADAHVLVIEIAHLAHRRDTFEMDGPLLARRQTHDG